MIVREDADLALAVRKGLNFAWMCGQGCTHLTRHLVSNRIRAAYVDRLAAAVEGLRLGNPSDPDVDVGPLIREAARARTESYVRLGQEEGARLVAGGGRPAHLGDGYFFEPTIFDDVRNDSRLAQEEVFGPVLSVIGFDDDEEALRLANESRFGLGGRIISRDVAAAMRMALRVRTGTLAVNDAGLLVDSPFGGFKRSGLGREWGEEGYNEYTELKTVVFNGA
jgi:acyl-CoA reductase-like NAD-dependent aldehyde dehydrogenase